MFCDYIPAPCVGEGQPVLRFVWYDEDQVRECGSEENCADDGVSA